MANMNTTKAHVSSLYFSTKSFCVLFAYFIIGYPGVHPVSHPNPRYS